MFNSSIFDVALGLSLVYLLLSTLCLVTNEFIESFARQRAAGLRQGIDKLLGTGLAKRLYEHALIKGLSQGETGPSYIPARAFAASLLHVVFPGGVSEVAERGALRELIEAAQTVPTDSHVREALCALLDRADGRPDRLRAEIEAWYNQAMDRVSGWYKRRIQYITIAVSALVVVGLNIDTWSIAHQLSTDPLKRTQLVALAEARAKAPPPAPPSESNTATEGLQSVADRYNDLNALGLDIGWSKAAYTPPKSKNHALWWLQRLVGMLMTIAATSLGAPFWFDVLNKIIVIRSTVKPHEKSPEEGSKDAA